MNNNLEILKEVGKILQNMREFTPEERAKFFSQKEEFAEDLEGLLLKYTNKHRILTESEQIIRLLGKKPKTNVL